VPVLPQTVKAARFRRNATACGILAANALSSPDRALLLRMQRSWLERACHEDWLNDSPPGPPAGSQALARPRH
jgi:hypothetical protein